MKKKLENLNDEKFSVIEKDQMAKITGGAATETATVYADGSGEPDGDDSDWFTNPGYFDPKL